MVSFTTIVALAAAATAAYAAPSGVQRRQTGVQGYYGTLALKSIVGNSVGPSVVLVQNNSFSLSPSSSIGVRVRFDHCSQEYMQLSNTSTVDYGHLHLADQPTLCLGLNNTLGPSQPGIFPVAIRPCILTNDDYQSFETWKYVFPTTSNPNGVLTLVDTPGGKAPELGFVPVGPNKTLNIINTPVPQKLLLVNPVHV